MNEVIKNLIKEWTNIVEYFEDNPDTRANPVKNLQHVVNSCQNPDLKLLLERARLVEANIKSGVFFQTNNTEYLQKNKHYIISLEKSFKRHYFTISKENLENRIEQCIKDLLNSIQNFKRNNLMPLVDRLQKLLEESQKTFDSNTAINYSKKAQEYESLINKNVVNLDDILQRLKKDIHNIKIIIKKFEGTQAMLPILERFNNIEIKFTKIKERIYKEQLKDLEKEIKLEPQKVFSKLSKIKKTIKEIMVYPSLHKEHDRLLEIYNFYETAAKPYIFTEKPPDYKLTFKV